MRKQASEYRRLSRTGLIALTSLPSALYIASDHLLCVRVQFLSERYKRFYYQDIQAIITRRTSAGRVWNIILAIAVGLLASACLIWGPGSGGAIFGWIVAGFFSILLAINWMRGPTCACHLVTAVQTEHLPSLNRLRTAGKTIGLLRALIEQAQGQLPEGEIEVMQAETPRSTVSPPPPGALPVQALRPPKSYRGNVHRMLYYLLFVDGGLTLYGVFNSHTALLFFNLAFLLALGVYIVMALVRQAGTSMGRGLKGITWGVLAYLCISVIAGYIYSVTVFMRDPALAFNQLRYIRSVVATSPLESPALMAMYVFSILCSFLLGVFGMILLIAYQRQYSVPPPLPGQEQSSREAQGSQQPDRVLP